MTRIRGDGKRLSTNASATHALRRNLLLSASIVVGGLASYGRAQAQVVCNSTGGSSYQCTGTSDDTQTIAADNADVTAEGPLAIDTTGPGGSGGNAITITGDGAISFTDGAGGNATLTSSATGLEVFSGGDAGGTAGSLTIDTAATITGGGYGINASNYGSGATSVTVNGDVTATDAYGAGISARALISSSELNVTTGAGSTVSGGAAGIFAFNSGTGATTVTANGDVAGAYGVGIFAQNVGAATDLTIATGAGSAVSGVVGIVARNFGIGATTVTVGGEVSSTGAYGVSVENGASATGLTVTTAAGSRVEANVAAIRTRNGGTGATTITAYGDVVGTGVAGVGIQARNDPLASDLTVTTGVGSTVSAGGVGIDTTNFGAGATTITVNGDISSLTSGGYGIRAYNGGSATDLSVTTAAGTTISRGKYGIRTENTGTGSTTITANGDVEGALYGIVAENSGSATDLTVTTGVGSDISGGITAIRTRNLGAGATTIKVNGDVTGTIARGIVSANGETATDLTVTTGADSSVYGVIDGIVLFNRGTGTTAVTVGGDVTGAGGDGIYAESTSAGAGPIEVTVLAGASVESGGTDDDSFGIQLEGAAGDVTVAGAVIGGAGGAIQFDVDAAFDDRLELQSGFAIDGLVDAGLGDDAFVLGGPATPDGEVATLDIGLVSGDGIAEAGEQFVGFDNFAKEDASTFELTGSNDEIEDFAVSGGLLLVNAEMAGTAFDVAKGAALGGGGTLGSFVAERGAVVAPGSAPGEVGTLSVTGEAQFEAGSTFLVDVADGSADRIVADTATIEGGIVAVNGIDTGASYADGQQFVIIDAANGITGTFDGVIDNVGSIFLDFELVHDLTQVILETDVSAFSTAAETVNQTEAATALNELAQTPGSDALFVFNQVLLSPTAEAARQAFDLSSGEIHASVQHALAGSGSLFAETLRRRAGLLVGSDLPGSEPLSFTPGAQAGGHSPFALAADAPEAPVLDYATSRTFGAWVTALGGQTEIDGDGGRGVGAADLDFHSVGVAAGVEGSFADLFGGVADGFLLGLAGGYSDTDANLSARLSKADIASGHLGVYTAAQFGLLHLSAASSFGWHNVETERSIRFGAIDRDAAADYDASTFASSGEASLRFGGANLSVSPFAAYNLAHVDRDDFTESGANALDLAGDDEDFTTVDVSAGVALGYEVALGTTLVRTDLRLAYEHGFGDDRPASVATLAGAPGSPLTVLGPEADDDRLAVGAGLGASLASALTASVRYDGAFGDDIQSHRGHLSVGYRF